MADSVATPKDNVNAELEDFAKGGSSQYIKFDETGEPIEGLYLGYTKEEDPFKPGEQRIVYDLEIEQEKKSLASSSKRLARAFIAAKATVGDFVRITRNGEGFETDYSVEVSAIPF